MFFTTTKRTVVVTRGVRHRDDKEPLPVTGELDAVCKRVDRAVKHIAEHNIFVVSEDPGVHALPACVLVAYNAATMHRAKDSSRGSGISRLVYSGNFPAIPVDFVNSPQILWAIKLVGLGPNHVSVAGQYDTGTSGLVVAPRAMPVIYADIVDLQFSVLAPTLMEGLLDEYKSGGVLDSMRVSSYRDGIEKFCKAEDPIGLFQLMMSSGNSFVRIKELLKTHLNLKIKLDDQGCLIVS